jgi:Ca-activated chloride channel family protein
VEEAAFVSAFGYPVFLWLLVLVAGLGAAFLLSYRTMQKSLRDFASMEMTARLGLGNGSKKFIARSSFILLSAVLAVVALARPLGPSANAAEAVPVSMDVIVALDISDSMGVTDGSGGGNGDRLSAAKEFINNLAADAPSDRFGLVLFSGNSIISCPPTMDHDAFLNILADAGMDKQDLPGTAIGDALITAATKFKKSDLPRAVVVVTDGENTYGPDPVDAARAAEAKGLKVYTVGVGTARGGTIPEGLDFFGQMTFKKDREGQTVISSLDEGTLKSVAEAGGGKYFYSLDPGAVTQLAKELSPKAKGNTLEKFAGAEEYGPWFALGAAIALMAALII